MVDDLTPRRVRPTYGGSARRRRLAIRQPRSPDGDSDSDLSRNHPAKAKSPFSSPRSSPRSRSLRSKKSLPDLPPRTPSPTRPSSSQPLSQDIASAFELASPGSAQNSPGLALPSFNTSPLAGRSPGLDSCPQKAHDDKSNDDAPQLPKPPGFASRMNKARKRDESLIEREQKRRLHRMHDNHDLSPRACESQPAADSEKEVVLPSLRRSVSPTRESKSMLLEHAPRAIGNFAGVRTYGGSNRSYLAEQTPKQHSHQTEAQRPAPADHEDNLTPKRRETYAERRSRWVIEDTLQEDDDTRTAEQALRSLTRLRSAGAMKRFKDELDYLMAGLRPDNKPDVLRSAAVNLVSQLCGSSDELDGPVSNTFLHQLKTAQAQRQLWEALRKAGGGKGADAILDWCVAITLFRFAQKSAFGEDFFPLYTTDVCQCLSAMIASDSNTTSVRSQARNEDATLDSLANLFRSACPLTMPQEVSLLTISLAAVCALGSLHRTRTTASMQLALLGEDCSVPKQVLQVFHSEAHKAKQRLDAHRDGTSLYPSASTSDSKRPECKTPNLDHLDLIAQCVEILDVHIENGTGDKENSAEDGVLAADVADLLKWLYLTATKPATAANKSSEVWTTTSSILRLGITRSQMSAEWAGLFCASKTAIATLSQLIIDINLAEEILANGPTGTATKADVDGAEEDEQDSVLAQRYDTSCLALAFLTSLLERHHTAADSLSSVWTSSTCTSLACEDSCQCEAPDRRPALVSFFELCLRNKEAGSDSPSDSSTGKARDGHEEEEEDVVKASRRFLAGCLSVTIALAVHENSPCLSILRSTNKDGSVDAVKILSECLNDLALLNGDDETQTADLSESDNLVRRMASSMQALCEQTT